MQISINRVHPDLYEVRSSTGIYKVFSDKVNANHYANGIVDGYNVIKRMIRDDVRIINYD
jgi:hypothetical protein